MGETGLEVIDVDRRGRWCQVLLLEIASTEDALAGAMQMNGDREGMPFIGIISADLGPELVDIVAALRPGLQEIICFDALTGTGTGQDLAMRLLEEGAFGQDFVFTVPMLGAAVDYAVDALQRPGHGGWEGRFVVVVGPEPVVARARAHLTEPA